jgi:hypothetical protein
VHRQIVALFNQSSIKGSEQQLLVEQAIKDGNVTVELCASQFFLAGEDFVINRHVY